jgi:Holliday junction resolvase RusA-like endonuclease
VTFEHSGVVPWQPAAKKRPRISQGGRRTHQDPVDKEAEKETSDHLRESVAGLPIPRIKTNVSVRLVFYRRTAQRVDVDNLIKHFLDSANGILWLDDCQITRISAELHLDRTSPRTEWRLTEHRDSTMVRDLSK